MVQLPATAAIEYVAAGHFFPGGFLSGRAFVRGTFSPGALLAGGIFVQEGFCPGDCCPGGHFWPGGFLSRRAFARGTVVRGAYARSPKFNAYTHRLGFLCLALSMFTLLLAVYS